MNKLFKLWEKWSTKGLHFPYAHDPVSKKPSITLMFPYITFVTSVISLILLHIWPSLIIATSVSIFFWAISVVFYMLRKLSKAKIDLNDQTIDLDSGENSES